MKNNCPNPQPTIIAAVVASVLIIILGLAHRITATLLCPPLNKVPINANALDGLPLQIRDWIGQDVPLDEDIVRRTATDAHVNRRYSQSSSRKSVSLYIGCGANTRELMIHRPEVCYVVAGWLLVKRLPLELSLDDGTKLPCSVFQFTRTGLDTRRVTVLNYFIVNGERCGDASLWKSKSWRDFAEVDYVAQVQIVTSAGALEADEATGIVCDFAADSAHQIRGLLDGMENDRSGSLSYEMPRQK